MTSVKTRAGLRHQIIQIQKGMKGTVQKNEAGGQLEALKWSHRRNQIALHNPA